MLEVPHRHLQLLDHGLVSPLALVLADLSGLLAADYGLLVMRMILLTLSFRPG